MLNPGQVIPQSNPSINSGFKMPLPGGKEWLINQGTHNNNTKPALDFGATFKENGKSSTKSDIPVLASATGKVIRSEYIAPPPGGHEWGNVVWIDHDQPYNGSGYVTIYAHLNTKNVQEGSLVNQGDQIGTMGTSGNVPLHLHFEVMYNDKAIGKNYTPTSVSNKQIQNFRLDGQPLTSYSNVGERYDTYKPSTNKYMDLSTLPSFPKK
ncbi:M23 family metallopeptidase [Microcoleus sp. Aus8_D2]|uniref:M23 family metallopeptidase n=1 Tax=unclassified Microcoleus TaxID=2642155 RepID=UPI003FA528AA